MISRAITIASPSGAPHPPLHLRPELFSQRFPLSRSYPYLARDVEPGKHILIADGSLDLEVLSCDEFSGTVRARCRNSATIGERKNVNLPGVKVDLPTLTDKDVSDLVDFGVANDIDFVAASFVRQGKDVENVRSVLGDAGKHIKIISKVENQEGLVNFDQVLSASDGVMVARGDLGMEIPTEKIFLAQKARDCVDLCFGLVFQCAALTALTQVMIKKCNTAGKPVVTATQMLVRHGEIHCSSLLLVLNSALLNMCRNPWSRIRVRRGPKPQMLPTQSSTELIVSCSLVRNVSWCISFDVRSPLLILSLMMPRRNRCWCLP